MTGVQLPELYWLTLTVAFSSILSLPYVAAIIVRQYPVIAERSPFTAPIRLLKGPPEPGSDRYAWAWGQRAYGAHMNAVENLVVFVPLVFIVYLTQSSNEVTAAACQVYFWARLIHAPFYIFNVPYVRTLSWTVGLVATLVIAYQLLIRL